MCAAIQQRRDMHRLAVSPRQNCRPTSASWATRSMPLAHGIYTGGIRESDTERAMSSVFSRVCEQLSQRGRLPKCTSRLHASLCDCSRFSSPRPRQKREGVTVTMLTSTRPRQWNHDVLVYKSCPCLLQKAFRESGLLLHAFASVNSSARILHV